MHDLVAQAGDADLVLTDQERFPTGPYVSFGKRVFDILVVLCTAPVVVLVLFPFLVLVARDGGNPFYTQQRLGRGGKVYSMWKLRSMVMDADKELDAYLQANPEAKREWDHSQKLKNDPRITKIGQLIRKTSLDELPQLWNVLTGEMSLVGPRPMMVSQKDMYLGQDYYALRPGITGAWQVSARNESSFAERASYDSLYLRRLSAWTDVRILAKTVVVVCKATGH